LHTIDLTDVNLDESLVSDFKDFEDAVQYQSALYVKADYIITRNQKDFKKSKIPVRTPTEFLSQLS
jgi:predicted nucleic acid-binding protein